MSLCLTDKEILELTGKERPAAQARELVERIEKDKGILPAKQKPPPDTFIGSALEGEE